MPDDESRRDAAPAEGPEARLIAAHLAGEVGAFGLMDGWIRTELRVRFPILRAESDDLAQAIHARLIEIFRAGEFGRRSTLQTYVVHIARYRAVDRVRRTRRDRLFADPEALDRAVAGEGPCTRLFARERGELLRRILMIAPETCRELWPLALVEGLGFREIARRLEIPEGTVKSRMWYCRRRALALFDRAQRGGRATRDSR